MCKVYLPFLFLLIFSSFLLVAQDAVLNGKAYDKQTGEGLVGATIILEDNSGTSTDIEGKFSIKVPPGEHDILCHIIGFETRSAHVILKPNETKTIEFALPPITTQLKTVVVSASRFKQELSDVTVSMELLKPKIIENKNTYNMETIMDQVPGVNIMDGQANIRGGSGFSYGAGSRVLVLVDDLPMLAADAGDVKWNFLPVENLEQIEVLKGASSALFGSSALNGVINIRTSYPKDKPETRINVFHGIYCDPVRKDSTGNKRDSTGHIMKPLRWWGEVNPMYTGMNFYHMRKIRNFDLVVGGNTFSDQGYREGETEQRFRGNFNTRYRFKKIRGLNAGFNVNAQKNTGAIYLLWANADSGAYRPMGGVDTPATSLSRYITGRLNIDPSIIYYTKKGGKHSLRGRYYNTTNRNDTKQESIADLYYSEYQYQKLYLNDFSITMGVAYAKSVIKSELYSDHEEINLAGYTQMDKKYKRLILSLGIRGEYYKIDTVKTSSEIYLGPDTTTFPFHPVFRSGVNYKLAKSTYIRASFGQGYRFPSIAEKYVNTSIGSSLRLFPNPDLTEEMGWSCEVGLKQGFKIQDWSGYIDVAGFWTEYKNMIEFAFGLYNPDTVTVTLFNISDWLGFQAQNVGRAQIKGLDFTLAGQGQIGQFGVSILAGYTYMYPLNLNNDSLYLITKSDSASNMLKYRFNHLAKADLQVDYKKWSVGWSMRYNSVMTNVDAIFERPIVGNTYITPGVEEYRKEHNKGDVVFDMRISCQVGKESKIALISNNILNREYMGRPADMQPPRTVAIQYTLSF